MNLATPAVRELARRLLGIEINNVVDTCKEACAALAACSRLREHLSKLVGVAGFQVLLARALVLAKPEAAWLETVYIAPDATLVNYLEASQLVSAQQISIGSVALLAQFIGLLVTFIGEELTLRILEDMWPGALSDHENLGSEETPA